MLWILLPCICTKCTSWLNTPSDKKRKNNYKYCHLYIERGVDKSVNFQRHSAFTRQPCSVVNVIYHLYFPVAVLFMMQVIITYTKKTKQNKQKQNRITLRPNSCSTFHIYIYIQYIYIYSLFLVTQSIIHLCNSQLHRTTFCAWSGSSVILSRVCQHLKKPEASTRCTDVL